MEVESAIAFEVPSTKFSARSFMQKIASCDGADSELRGPISFTANDILGAYVKEYNASNASKPREAPDQITLSRCTAIGGRFTYYGESVLDGKAAPNGLGDWRKPNGTDKPQEKKSGKPFARSLYDVSASVCNDLGWGCAWRASINLLNALTAWLKERHFICLLPDAPPVLHMAHVTWLIPEIGAKDWMEPHDNAELLIRYIRTCYSAENQIRIHALVGFRGYLFLRDYASTTGEWEEQMESIDEELDATGKENARVEANREVLDEYFARMAEKVATKRTGLKRLMRFYNEQDNGNESATNGSCLQIDESKNCQQQLATTVDVLARLYSSVQANRNLDADSFPRFDAETHPFPCNVDDGTLARNLFGRHVIPRDNDNDRRTMKTNDEPGGEQDVCDGSESTMAFRSAATGGTIGHVFVGEVHVWEKQSPWTRSAWERTETVFGHKNVMLFEVYPK